MAGLLMGVSALALAGCSSSSSLNPVNWWHGLQGGKIAEDRPPPPGANDPYPNLASVPARPQPPDRDAMKQLTSALVADRRNAQYTAETAPLPDPSSPQASPALFGSGTLPPPPPPGPPAMSASLPAASAPPAPPPITRAEPEAPAAPPSRAPRTPVQGTPLEEPTATAPAPEAAVAPATPPAPSASPMPAPSAAAPMAAPSVAPSAAAPVASAPPPAPAETATAPSMPAQPPPRPGVAPAPPGPAPQPIAPTPQAGSGQAIMVGFPAGAAELSPAAAGSVKEAATLAGGKPVTVTGYGEAMSPDPTTQSNALALGLARAEAVASALAANGVPRSSIRVTAEAGGRGAAIRLLP